MPSFICSFPGEALLTSNFDTLHLLVTYIYIVFPLFFSLNMLLIFPRLSCVLCAFTISRESRKLPFYSVLYVADQASSFIFTLLFSIFRRPLFLSTYCLSLVCAQSKGDAGHRYPTRSALPIFTSPDPSFHIDPDFPSHCQFVPATVPFFSPFYIVLCPRRLLSCSPIEPMMYDMIGTPLSFVFSLSKAKK